MTVKEALKALRNAENVDLCFGQAKLPFEKENPLAVEAWGGYVVDTIEPVETGYVEINIAIRAVKEGEECEKY